MPEKPAAPIDLSLTPENAAERGYTWLYDIFDGMLQDPLIKSLVDDDGYKLGQASQTNYVVAAGVYEPVRKQQPQKVM